MCRPDLAGPARLCGGQSCRGDTHVTTGDIVVAADAAKEAAKYESQSTTIITKEDIAAKQAKSVEDIIFNEVGVTRTVDAMGRVGVSVRGAEPRHTLILVDGQPVMGDFAKYYGAADELQRLGTENVERIEIIRGAASAKYGADAIGGVINVVTRQPSKRAGLQVNAEGRREKGNGDLFPYSNFFLRADSGQMGKFRISAYGTKRDIMPIYASEKMTHSASSEIFYGGTAATIKNSLRYYGDTSDIGLSASYNVDDHNTINLRANRYTEDLERYVKHTDSVFEPLQYFKRKLDRNTYNVSWQGNNRGGTDWDVEFNYSRMNEDDVALSSDYAKSVYEGKNTLEYVDDIDHRQYDFKATANTQVNDRHLLTYGVGYTYEKGSGSRLKNAPHTYMRHIDPWDYDKSLQIDEKTGKPGSNIHYYKWKRNAAGQLEWDYNYEKYGSSTNTPELTEEEFDLIRDPNTN
ncbi:TonB-dependent receptor plug domain-containing protein [Megasphaera coli]|nr:TonB-dependent receptor plug domain-containing protein [Colibacter massiliensis]